MARVRNNQGYRKKVLDIFIKPYLEQENTQEREGYLQAREVIKPLQDETWKLAKTIVRRHYTDEDVKMAYHLQNKFENVDTIAKDSCFHFGYYPQKDVEDKNQEDDEKDKYITKHFDFRLDGNINGQGTFTLSDGDMYVGEFKDGKRNGQGTLTFSNGNKYLGKFKNGKFNGQGTYTWSDGNKGVGEFRYNKPWDITIYDKNGNITGRFVNGEWIKQYPP